MGIHYGQLKPEQKQEILAAFNRGMECREILLRSYKRG